MTKNTVQQIKFQLQLSSSMSILSMVIDIPKKFLSRLQDKCQCENDGCEPTYLCYLRIDTDIVRRIKEGHRVVVER